MALTVVDHFSWRDRLVLPQVWRSETGADTHWVLPSADVLILSSHARESEVVEDLQFDLVGPQTLPLNLPLAADRIYCGVVVAREHALRLFPHRPFELTGEKIPLSDVSHALAEFLKAIVSGVEADELQHLLIETIWAALDVRPPAEDLHSYQVAYAMRASGGMSSVDTISKHLGISGRSIRRAFASCCGMRPKSFSRHIRLSSAINLVRANPKLSWAAAAYRMGYCDQAHLAREISALVGIRAAALRPML